MAQQLFLCALVAIILVEILVIVEFWKHGR